MASGEAGSSCIKRPAANEAVATMSVQIMSKSDLGIYYVLAAKTFLEILYYKLILAVET